MITVLLVMLAGILTGFFINNSPRLIKANEKLISWAIFLLLFLLGISVGINKTIIRNLDQIGFQALIITLGAITGSVITLWILYRYFFNKENIGGNRDEK